MADNRIVAEALAELGGLPASLIGQVHADGTGKPVFRGQLRRAMAHEEQSSRGHGRDLNA